MDQAARVAFVQAQTVCAMARLEEMKAANRLDEMAGRNATYSPADFAAVPDSFLIGHNAVIDYLREG